MIKVESEKYAMKKKMQEKEESSNRPVDETQDIEEKNNNSKNKSTETGNIGDSLTDKVLAEINSLEEKLADAQDKYLRLSAEFDNYRKRTLKEKMELSKYAEENILSKIVPFMDDFDRAIQHMDASDTEAIKNGINLIYSKFNEFLIQNGVTEIEALNTDFNVDLHDAVAKAQVEDVDQKGKVVDVILKGYYLRDKILRHAKVVVGE
jgi:molecular chaperone GrpE